MAASYQYCDVETVVVSEIINALLSWVVAVSWSIVEYRGVSWVACCLAEE